MGVFARFCLILMLPFDRSNTTTIIQRRQVHITVRGRNYGKILPLELIVLRLIVIKLTHTRDPMITHRPKSEVPA